MTDTSRFGSGEPHLRRVGAMPGGRPTTAKAVRLEVLAKLFGRRSLARDGAAGSGGGLGLWMALARERKRHGHETKRRDEEGSHVDVAVDTKHQT